METVPSVDQIHAKVLESAAPLTDGSEIADQFYGIVQRTPLESSLTDTSWSIKDETAQPVSAYKLRGATHAIATAQRRFIDRYGQPLTEVHTVSTGNHGLSVSYAAQHLGVTAVIHAPETLTAQKRQRLEAFGEPRLYASFQEAQDGAQKAAAHIGALFVPPFDHIDVMAGQSTVGSEIVTDLLQRGWRHNVVIPVPLAGGGLLSGIAISIFEAKRRGELGPNVTVVGVQPAGTDAMRRTIERTRQGRHTERLFASGEFDTDCDALAIQQVGALPTAVIADTRFVSEISLIEKADIADAMFTLYDLRGVWYEPAAALSYAYAVQRLRRSTKAVLPLTGSNLSDTTRDAYRRAAADARWARFKERSEQTLEAHTGKVKPSGKKHTGHPAISGYVQRNEP
jgi:threonine dehydratase